VRNGVFATVHTIVSGAVEPARGISRGGRFADPRIETRDQISRAGRPVREGLGTESTACCARNGAPILKILRKFFPESGQRVRPLLPPNRRRTRFDFREIAVY
jgi:hypothetical protein